MTRFDMPYMTCCLCPQRFFLLSFCDYSTITAEKFEGGQHCRSFVIVKSE